MLFILGDRAAPHYKSQKVKLYFEKHKDSLIPVWLPTASPEFMVLEECCNISKADLLVMIYYQSFTDFKMKIGQYFRTRRFNLNMRNYLVRSMS
jgi:transposase